MIMGVGAGYTRTVCFATLLCLLSHIGQIQFIMYTFINELEWLRELSSSAGLLHVYTYTIPAPASYTNLLVEDFRLSHPELIGFITAAI